MNISKNMISLLAILSYTTFSFSNNKNLVSDAGHHHDAIGVPGKYSEISRTVVITASDDMKFFPNFIQVKKNETLKFIIKNKGQLNHEFVLGKSEELKKHAEMMRTNPNMKHEESNFITLKPGETKELVWKFTKKGDIDFACLIPSHFELGMKDKIKSE